MIVIPAAAGGNIAFFLCDLAQIYYDASSHTLISVLRKHKITHTCAAFVKLMGKNVPISEDYPIIFNAVEFIIRVFKIILPHGLGQSVHLVIFVF